MGFFPAAAVGWVPSNEAFWGNTENIVPYLKIRYSDGVVGNDVLGDDNRFGFQTEITDKNGYPIYGVTGTVSNGIGINKYGYKARWSSIRKQDLGMEINFLDNDLSVVFDLFKENRSNIYVTRENLPVYAGFATTPAGNIGQVKNEGFEISANYNHRFSDDLFVSIQGNFTTNRDKVIEDGKTVYEYAWRNSIGHNVLARFGYIAEGLLKADELDPASSRYRGITQFGETRPGQLTKPGDIKYKDLNGDNHIDENDMCVIGHGDVPKHYFGFGGDVRYKNWGLGILFQGTSGADRALNGTGIYPFVSSSGGGTLFSNISDRWNPDNPDNDHVFYPRLAWSAADPSNANNFVTSTWWQKDMSFIRLKQFTISYYFPKSWTDKGLVKGGRFYFMGSNVFTWSSFKLWDPELSTDNGIKYPNVTAYSLGVNFDF
jgi:TonB-linked SusC/RagA family outer membrane protein